MATLLRLNRGEWHDLSYQRIEGPHRLFCGRVVDLISLNTLFPRFCPKCLCTQPVWWAVWDLSAVSACPIHQCQLIDTCPHCKRRLRWFRPKLSECKCGQSLSAITAPEVNGEVAALHSLIFDASGDPFGGEWRNSHDRNNFPTELGGFPLNVLLRLITFLGTIAAPAGLRSKREGRFISDLGRALECTSNAAYLLSEWPQRFCRLISSRLPASNDPNDLALSKVFGSLYRHMHAVLPPKYSSFILNPFKELISAEWNGIRRGRPRQMLSASEQPLRWISLSDAAKMTGINPRRFLTLEGVSRIPSSSSNSDPDAARRKTWLYRPDFETWLGSRRATKQRYMRTGEAQSRLGLEGRTLLNVAKAGTIGYKPALNVGFSSGRFAFLAEDIEKVEVAFSLTATPASLAKSAPGDGTIRLQDAVIKFIGHDEGLAKVIRDTLSGHLHPLGRSPGYRGIMGAIFTKSELLRYGTVTCGNARFDDLITLHEAEKILGTDATAVGALAAAGSLTPPVRSAGRSAKLVPRAEVETFSKKYIATVTIARQKGIQPRVLLAKLKHLYIPLLEIQVNRFGWRTTNFVERSLLPQIDALIDSGFDSPTSRTRRSVTSSTATVAS